MKANDILRSINNDVASGRISEIFSSQITDLFREIDSFLEKEYPKFHKAHAANWGYYRITTGGICIASALPNGEHCEINFYRAGSNMKIFIEAFRPAAVELAKDSAYWVLATDEEIITTFEINTESATVAFARFTEYLKQF
jgi:hypothetical protein